MEPPATHRPPANESPPSDVRPDEGRRWSDKWDDADLCARQACSGRGHYRGAGKVGHRGARAKAVVELVEARPASARRPG
jgi:hypothetical protein